MLRLCHWLSRTTVSRGYATPRTEKESECYFALRAACNCTRLADMASSRSLKEQAKWMDEKEALGKATRKLSKRAAVPGADFEKIHRKMAKVKRRIAEMEAEEAAVVATITPPPSTSLKHRHVFSLKKTPSSAIATPAFGGEEVLRRAERNQRFASLETDTGSTQSSVTLQELRLSMAAAFGARGGSGGGEEDPEGQWAPAVALYGTSTALEKPYLRLTSAPPRDTIRPPKVLKKSLKHVKRKWLAAVQSCVGEELKQAYDAFCTQMKAIRQDLTVQHIKSTLTVSVYETHARVALEVSDTAELTQCAGCLRRLYAEGLQGEEGEFAAYQLLLAAVQGGAQAVTLELLSLARRSRELVAEGRGDLSSHPFVRHAAAVAEAARCANFYRFFSLYCDAPRMSAYLMDAMLPRMRATGLRTLIAAHGTAVDLEFVADVLGLEGARAAAEYLTAYGAVVDRSRGVMDPKASRAPTAGPHLPS